MESKAEKLIKDPAYLNYCREKVDEYPGAARFKATALIARVSYEDLLNFTAIHAMNSLLSASFRQGRIDYFEEREGKRKINLPLGAAAAGKKSANQKVARLAEVRKALKKQGTKKMTAHKSAKWVTEDLLANRKKYFSGGKQPYSNYRGLYDVVRKVRSE